MPNWILVQKKERLKRQSAQSRGINLIQHQNFPQPKKVETIEEFLQRGGKIKKLPIIL
jgi:hypothetical protein